MPSLTFESRAVGGAGRGGGAAEEKEDMPSRHRTVSNLLSLDQQENRSAIVIENSDGKVLGLTTLMIMMMKKLFMTTDGASLVICVCILNMEWTALARHLPSSSLLSVSCLPSIHASWKSFVRPWEPLCAHQACKTCPPPKKKDKIMEVVRLVPVLVVVSHVVPMTVQQSQHDYQLAHHRHHRRRHQLRVSLSPNQHAIDRVLERVHQ